MLRNAVLTQWALSAKTGTVAHCFGNAAEMPVVVYLADSFTSTVPDNANRDHKTAIKKR